MRWIIRGLSLLICGVALLMTAAESDSPVGKWKTFDDKTGRVKSIVQITEENGELTGKVLEVLESPTGPHPLCKPCQGERKDQPVEGMTILWGAKKSGASWEGGEILDPENGKIYHVILTLLGSGGKLQVRGYIGIPVIGRRQIWQRQEEQSSKR
jgi:uncharacterized protein (DUF2147 family)